MSNHYNVESYYWIQDSDDVFVPAQLTKVISKTNFEFSLYPTRKKITRPPSDIKSPVLLPNSLNQFAHDLVDSNDISEPYILWSLRKRFVAGDIYSSIGSIIIALNPYQDIPNLYSDEAMARYLNYATLERTPPHVWKMVRETFERLSISGRRQALIISGESGAGKTETTKKCLQVHFLLIYI